MEIRFDTKLVDVLTARIRMDRLSEDEQAAVRQALQRAFYNLTDIDKHPGRRMHTLEIRVDTLLSMAFDILGINLRNDTGEHLKVLQGAYDALYDALDNDRD